MLINLKYYGHTPCVEEMLRAGTLSRACNWKIRQVIYNPVKLRAVSELKLCEQNLIFKDTLSTTSYM